jgi:hypothetical protein
VQASAVHDGAAVVHHVRIHARSRADGTWSTSLDQPLTLGDPLATEVEYYVELIGAGGAVLARLGSDAAPARSSILVATGARSSADESGVAGWLLPVGIGLAALGVGVGVFLLIPPGQSEDTQPSPFQVEF